MGKRRSDLALLAGLLGITVVLFWPVLWNAAVPFGGDDELTARLFEELLREEMIENGRVPLWNPYVFAGMPTVDSLTYPIFYPFHALYGAVPALRGFFHHIALHIFLAGVFAFLYARELGLGRWSAALAAIAFGFTGYTVTLTGSGHGGKIWTSAYLPLVLYTQRRVLLRPGAGTVSAAGLAAGMQMLAGHYQMVFYTWIAGGVQWVWRMLRPGPGADASTGGRSRASAAWFSVMVIAVAISAVQFVPALKYRDWSNRSQPDYSYLASYSFPPSEIVNFAAPEFFGFTPETGMSGYWGSLKIRGSTEYMGVMVLLLALVGIGASGARIHRFLAGISGALLLVSPVVDPGGGMDSWAGCLLVAALLTALWSWIAQLRAGNRATDPLADAAALLFAIGSLGAVLMVGDYLPTYEWIAHLPGFNAFRAPHSTVLLVSFAVSMLAGVGMERLIGPVHSDVDGATEERRGLAPAVVAGFMVVGWVVAGTLRTSWVGRVAEGLDGTALARIQQMTGGAGDADVQRAAVDLFFGGALEAWGLAALLAAAGALLIALVARGRMAPRTFACIACAVTALELVAVGRPYITPHDEAAALAAIDDHPLLQWLGEQSETLADRKAPVRVSNLAISDIRPNNPIRHRVQLTGGYHGAPMGDPWAALTSTEPGFSETLLRLLGARYLIYPDALDFEGAYRTLASMTAGGQSVGPYIIENLRALPRVRVVHSAKVVPHGEEQLRALADPEHDLARTAILDEESPVHLGGEGRAVARITAHDAHRVDVEALTDGPALLVLSDTYYPGWTATVNGEAAEIVRADFFLRAVPLGGEGRHDVVFEFAPRENRLGALVTLGALLVVGLGVVAGRRATARFR